MNPRNANSFLKTLGERVRYTRHQKGWTQDQLAMHAETNQAVIQKIENGKSLRPRKIDKIAEVLGVNPAWLMFGEEQAVSLSSEAKELAAMWDRLPDREKDRVKSDILRLSSRH
jgi:transcriptional regulator with XRE-family HTH domain